MKLNKKITLALGVLAAAGASFAQTTTSVGAGLLGQRYAEVNLAAYNLEDVSDDTYSTGVAFNLPAVPSLLDVGASYEYARFRAAGMRGHANTVLASATSYTALGGVKPFVTAGIGYEWLTLPFGSDDDGIWRAAVGVEIPVGAFTVTPRIAYDDDFDSGSGSWTYEVEGNYWFNARSAAFAKVSYEDIRDSSSNAWTYQVGLRFKF